MATDGLNWTFAPLGGVGEIGRHVDLRSATVHQAGLAPSVVSGVSFRRRGH